jgi:hypothetical protein
MNNKKMSIKSKKEEGAKIHLEKILRARGNPNRCGERNCTTSSAKPKNIK